MWRASWEAVVLPLNYARLRLFSNFGLLLGSRFLSDLGGIHKAVKRYLVGFLRTENDVRF